MEDAVQPSKLTRVASVSVFAFCALGAIGWFLWSAMDLVSQLVSGSEVVAFDKGAVYMLGVGLGLALLTHAGVHEGILGRPMTKQFGRWMNIGAIGSIGVMLLFPHVFHAAVGQYLVKSQGYQVCEEASYRWLLYRRIFYTSTPEICMSLAATRSS
jgi:hypothetical protein